MDKVKIYIASDHAGWKLKEELKKEFNDKKLNQKFDLIDLGPEKYRGDDDYPDYAKKVAKKVSEDLSSRGILLCGTGQGMCITANKFKGIYASLAYDLKSAKHLSEHDGVNVLCLPGKHIKKNKALKITKRWLKSRSKKIAERHQRRINKIKKIEEKNFKWGYN